MYSMLASAISSKHSRARTCFWLSPIRFFSKQHVRHQFHSLLLCFQIQLLFSLHLAWFMYYSPIVTSALLSVLLYAQHFSLLLWKQPLTSLLQSRCQDSNWERQFRAQGQTFAKSKLCFTWHRDSSLSRYSIDFAIQWVRVSDVTQTYRSNLYR